MCSRRHPKQRWIWCHCLSIAPSSSCICPMLGRGKKRMFWPNCRIVHKKLPQDNSDAIWLKRLRHPITSACSFRLWDLPRNDVSGPYGLRELHHLTPAIFIPCFSFMSLCIFFKKCLDLPAYQISVPVIGCCDSFIRIMSLEMNKYIQTVTCRPAKCTTFWSLFVNVFRKQIVW